MKKNNTTSYEALLAIVTGLLILFFLLRHTWLLQLALGLALAGLLIRPVAVVIDRLWAALTRALGFVMNHLLLTLVFFVVLLPVATLARLFRKDGMMLKKDRPSFFTDRNHTYLPQDLEKPW